MHICFDFSEADEKAYISCMNFREIKMFRTLPANYCFKLKLVCGQTLFATTENKSLT